MSFGGPSKPKCLIIDEIDGILGREGTVRTPCRIFGSNNKQGAISALTKLIDEKPSKKFQKSTDGKNNKNSKRLQRPIICICNDLWVPGITVYFKILIFKHYAN